MNDKVNLEEKFGSFEETYSPKIVGELNGQYVKLVKFENEFTWHAHENEDEMFLVTKGRVTIRLRDKDVVLNPGEFYIVPRGVEHKPVADGIAHVLLFEPATTLNTGDVRNDFTLEELDRI